MLVLPPLTDEQREVLRLVLRALDAANERANADAQPDLFEDRRPRDWQLIAVEFARSIMRVRNEIRRAIT